ncbi:MAG: amino acid permease [Bacteroidetes bacterium]|nr:amino acid permease [Bacteroidota bacterium]
MSQITFKNKIGLGLVSFIVLGMMLGGGIFVYTGLVYEMTGPALPLAFALAMIPVFISMLPLAMLGSAFPVSGANYIYPSRMISPALAFAAIWVYALASFFGQIPLYVIATGKYLQSVFPEIPVIPVALVILTFFYLINLFGIRIAAQIQGVLLALLVIALIIYSSVSANNIQVELFSGFFDKGASSIILGIGLLTFTYFGANGIIELGSEIKNPAKTIPRAFMIAFPLVTLLYVGVSLGTVGTLDPDSIMNTEDPLVQAARINLSHGVFVFFVLGGAVLALLTTLNALFLIGTRSLLMMVQDGLLPGWMGLRTKNREVPYVLLTMIWLLSIVGVLSGLSLETFASYAALGGLFIFLPILLAAWVFPKRYPEAYRKSKFRLSGFWLKLTVIVGVLMVLFFGLIILYDMGSLLKSGLFLLFIGSGFAAYYWRQASNKKKGKYRIIREDQSLFTNADKK